VGEAHIELSPKEITAKKGGKPAQKRIKAKTMERFIFPFVVLIIVFFIYLTYQDVVRVFSRFF
jgi:membrane-associated protease RseP (regulator of RpoE activity)